MCLHPALVKTDLDQILRLYENHQKKVLLRPVEEPVTLTERAAYGYTTPISQEGEAALVSVH